MLSLIKKDLLSARTYIVKQYGIMLIIFLGLSMFMGSSSYLAGILGMISYSLVISCFSFDESNGFQRYALTLPVSIKQIVGAKYILTLSTLLLTLFINLTVGSALSMFLKTPFIEHIVTCAVIFLMFLFTSSIGTPILIKYGVEKSRVPMMLTYMVPFLLGVFGFSIMQSLNIPAPSAEMLTALAIIAPIIIVMCFIFSYFFSVKLLKNKEV